MTTTKDRRAVDQDLLGAFLGRAIGDLGATVSAALVVLGDRLGLYRAMADGTPVTADDLAARTGTAVAYLRPWLANQAAGGYVEYDPATQAWSLTPEQSYALAQEHSTAFFPGSMQLALGILRDVPAIEERFRTGAGFGWHEPCSRAPSGSSAPAMRPTSSPTGSRRWTASSTGCPPARPSPTWAAGTAPRRS
jgi:hypothetical protein